MEPGTTPPLPIAKNNCQTTDLIGLRTPPPTCVQSPISTMRPQQLQFVVLRFDVTKKLTAVQCTEMNGGQSLLLPILASDLNEFAAF